jgi:hypothetical protein
MKVSYLQVAAKTREDVDEYQMLKRELGSVEIHLEFKTAATRWMKAAKL